MRVPDIALHVTDVLGRVIIVWENPFVRSPATVIYEFSFVLKGSLNMVVLLEQPLLPVITGHGIDVCSEVRICLRRSAPVSASRAR